MCLPSKQQLLVSSWATCKKLKDVENPLGGPNHASKQLSNLRRQITRIGEPRKLVDIAEQAIWLVVAKGCWLEGIARSSYSY